jgi:nitroreductase
MNTIEAIKSRRSVKNFDKDIIMPEEVEKELLSVAMLSPTAFNIQNWRFVVVKDKNLLGQLREAAWDQAQVTDCSLLVIMCADLKSWEKDPRRYWVNASKDVQDFLLPFIDGYYREKTAVQRDEALRSCGMAAQTLMLAAKAFGYDSCPMDGFDFDRVTKLINLPEDHIVAMFVAIGKKASDPWPRGGQLDMGEVVIQNSFPEMA